MKDFKSSALSWIRTLGWWFKHFFKFCYNGGWTPTLINSSVSFSDMCCSSRCRFLVLVVHSKQQFIATGLSEIWGFETKRAAKCLCYCFDVWTGEREKGSELLIRDFPDREAGTDLVVPFSCKRRGQGFTSPYWPNWCEWSNLWRCYN